MKEVLAEAVWRLNDLQSRVQELLGFFRSMSDNIDNMRKLHQKDFVDTIEVIEAADGIDETGYNDSDLRQHALAVKVHVTMIKRLSQCYSTISGAHILPGFRQIDEMGLSSTSLTKSERDSKLDALRAWKDEAKRDIMKTTAEVSAVAGFVIILADEGPGEGQNRGRLPENCHQQCKRCPTMMPRWLTLNQGGERKL